MIHFVVFSRNRPLQLHGYLTSLFRHVSEPMTVSVLARIDDPYQAAYTAICDQFPDVQFCNETDFNADVHRLVASRDAAYTCFGCDDVVITRTIQPDHIQQVFDTYPIVGFSLRLGRGMVSGMFGEAVPTPLFTNTNSDCLIWPLDHPLTQNDWAYPWEVLGTIYETSFVVSMLDQFEAHNPSQLEARGVPCWSANTPNRLMGAYPTPHLVVPTVNVVQHEFPNGIVGQTPLSAEFLLDCWNTGLRLDTEAFSSHAYSSWRIHDFFLKRTS